MVCKLKKIARFLARSVLAALVATDICACAEKQDESAGVRTYFHKSMGTHFVIKIAEQGGGKETISRVIDLCFEEVDRINDLFSSFDGQSPVSRINQNAGISKVKVPKEIIGMINLCRRLSEKVDGAFDITFKSMSEIWDYKKPSPSKPDAETIKNKLKLVNQGAIRIDENSQTVFLPLEGMKIGFGGIAKGYAVDRVSQILKKRGFRNFIVDGGGDMLVCGKKFDSSWHVGIRHPRRNTLKFKIEPVVECLALATSGDYEKYFEINGKRYHHIIDPRTGYPSTGVQSATAITDSAVLADAYSTSFLILGCKRAFEVAAKIPQTEAILTDDTGKARFSRGLESLIRVYEQKGLP